MKRTEVILLVCILGLFGLLGMYIVGSWKTKTSSTTLSTLDLGPVTKWIRKGYGSDGDYSETNPQAAFYEVVQELGNPTVLSAEKGGFAWWDAVSLERGNKPFARVLLLDEQIPHADPKPHTDFLYVTVDYAVSPEKAPEVMRLSDHIQIDLAKKQITVRCHSLAMVKAILVLALRIADSELSFGEVEDRNLYEQMTLAVVPGTIDYDIQADSENEEEIRQKITSFVEANKKDVSWGTRPTR